MCGIVGFLNRDPRAPAQLRVVEAMCDVIEHRGPDDQGVWVDGEIGMGMRRLAIIDLASGRQPQFSEDQQVAVVFNGEIYNHEELRTELIAKGHEFATRSDTEVLVHGYEEWGDGLPARLNGMFAFSVWDRRHRKLLLARDHLGVKPLYVYESQGLVAWASEIKSLLRLPGVYAELDRQALAEFLRFGYVPAPRTMFRGIRKLEPATCETWHRGESSSRRFWQLRFEEENRSDDEWCDLIRDQLDDSVRRQLMSDVPLGAFLSGGVDSSAIVASMRAVGARDINTYAIGFGAKDAFHNELDKAALVARHLGTNHHEIVVEPAEADLLPKLVYHLDEPMTDTSFLVTYLVSRKARESVKVILSGVGGDEIFAGYRRYLGPQLTNMYGRLPRWVRRSVVTPCVATLPVDRGSRMKAFFRHARGLVENAELPEDQRYQSYVGLFPLTEMTQLLTAEAGADRQAGDVPNQVADYYRGAPTSSSLNRMMYADTQTSLVDSLLAFSDKMSMAVSLEMRVPLLDFKLVELAARIPAVKKLRGMSGLKHIFKQAVAPRLPAGITRRRKQGFGTPISRWFRDELREFLHDNLTPARIRSRGHFRPEAVERLIREHDQQRADHSERLLAVLTFELWQQQFLD